LTSFSKKPHETSSPITAIRKTSLYQNSAGVLHTSVFINLKRRFASAKRLFYYVNNIKDGNK